MLEEELMELNNRVAELTSETGEAAIQRLQDEIKDCKSMLKCSVCSDRPKEVSELSAGLYPHGYPSLFLQFNFKRSIILDSLLYIWQVVIVKCYHLFCNP
jgi:ssDNA-specific exonuclease RecJ